MQNPRERRLAELLANMRDAREPATALPSHPTHQPDCPDLTDVMDVAFNQASPEVVEIVEEHLPKCDYCRACFAAYQAALQDEEMTEEETEPDPSGSMWEEMASGLDDLVVDEPSPVEEDTTDPTSDDGSTPQPAGEDATAMSSGPTATQETSSSPAEAGQRDAGTVTQVAEAVLRDPEVWPRMAKRLRPWLAAILRRAGADPAKVDELLAFVYERLLATPPREHYRSLILQWVQEFVAVPRHPIERAMIEQAALDQVLEQVGEHEPPEARQFREEALKQALPSSQALLEFAPEAIARAKWLPTFRLQLFYEAEKLKVKGLEFFQWN